MASPSLCYSLPSRSLFHKEDQVNGCLPGGSVKVMDASPVFPHQLFLSLRLLLSFPHPLSAMHPTSLTFQASRPLSTPLLRPPCCKLQPQSSLQREKQYHKTYSNDNFLNYVYIRQTLGVESSFRSKPVLINKSFFPQRIKQEAGDYHASLVALAAASCYSDWF